ncbi:glycosyl transferase family 2 [Pleionea mediterranea]|uniref:Glycosyl transferase family 2 n=2 Tax=Pleionea mediterranea TaxID=523701 RepID=A0A316FY25_9GAMM|nr:glycosyl transferase family 2 [Pleionea mediterranea]
MTNTPMPEIKSFKKRWYDEAASLFYRIASAGTLPPSWFRDALPPEKKRSKVSGPLTLEMVSHCWNYSHLLAYQLSSYCLFPPTKTQLTVTVFYCPEDKATEKLLNFFSTQEVVNVTWNWQPLSRTQLFRRSIGRNHAAKHTKADWIWFTDCDILFREGCLDALSEELQDVTTSLVFPRHESTTSMLDDDNPLLKQGAEPAVVDIDTSDFTQHSRDKAKGAFQIVHGDVARAIGYCDKIRLYQTEEHSWRKTYEDKVFRWLLGSRGTPVDIPNVFQIRHVSKGRYKENSKVSELRSKIRHLQE